MALIVARPLGDMNADGTGVVESVQHTSASHTAITHEFRITLPKNHNLFTAFSWSDVNTEGNTDPSSGVADFDISLNEATFVAALAGVINDASGGKSTAAFSVTTDRSTVAAAQTYTGTVDKSVIVLDREIRKEVENELDANGVLEYLEGDSLGEFALTLDASGGAQDMYNKLSVYADLRNLFLQLPNRTSEVAETDSSGTRLPVAVGDAIAFVFTIDPTVTITQDNVEAGAAGSSAGTANGLGTANMPNDDGTLASLTTANRKVVYIVDVAAAV